MYHYRKKSRYAFIIRFSLYFKAEINDSLLKNTLFTKSVINEDLKDILKLIELWLRKLEELRKLKPLNMD